MIGSLIGAGIGAVGSIFGGISASKAMKKYKAQVEQSKKENQDWYNRRYNEDATQTASAQRILDITEQNIRKRNKAAAGVAAVMGTGTEAAAAEKAANNAIMSDAVSQIQANAENRKERIEERYQARDAQLQDQLNQIEVGKAQNVSQAISGVAGAAGNIGSLIDDYAEERAIKKGGNGAIIS